MDRYYLDCLSPRLHVPSVHLPTVSKIKVGSVHCDSCTGADNGSLWFWDWNSGNSFQQQETIVQPGSLDSEAGGRLSSAPCLH